MVDKATIDRFGATLHGRAIQPDDEGYDLARKVYNASIDKHPQVVVRCADVDDVVSAVNFASANNLLLAIRGGGHSSAGFGTCDNGLVIDLSPMKGIRVDPAARTVWVEGGCTQGDIDRATHPFGLAVPAGIISTTGIAGLTLGAGHGYLSRKYGLTIDNLLAAEMVLANGERVSVSPTQQEDLFWAIRGGGGNFGVVTSFVFKAHPVDTVLAGPMLWDIDEAKQVMQWYRDFIGTAPEELSGFFTFMKVPPGDPFPASLHFKTMCGIVWCYSGDLETAESVFAPIRQFRPPAFELVGAMPYPAVQSMFDGLLPPGLQWYWKGDLLAELNDEAIDRHIKFGSQLPTLLSTMHMYPIDGAVNRVGKEETAFSYRDVKWSMIIAGIDPDPANKDPLVAWVRDYWNAVHPYSAGAAYVNFMMDEGGERIKATYQQNFDRLVAIKNKYDPNNLFRVNQNIHPSSKN